MGSHNFQLEARSERMCEQARILKGAPKLVGARAATVGLFAYISASTIAQADIISANCHYDIPAQTWPYLQAGQRRSERVDIDTTKLTVTIDSATTPADSDTFANGRSTRQPAASFEGGLLGGAWNKTEFVVVSDRYIWFGYDAKGDNGNSTSVKYRLDLQTGYMAIGGDNLQCEKAEQNVFR
jgi:hypothetical protein